MTITSKGRVVEIVWSKAAFTDRPCAGHDSTTTILVASDLPEKADIVELHKLLGAVQLKMAVQKTYNKLALELILLNHGP